MKLSVKIIDKIFTTVPKADAEDSRGNLIDEFFLTVFLKEKMNCFKAGWVSKEELIQLFLTHFKTRKTVLRWIDRLEQQGWLTYSNGNYHHRAMWRIMNDLGIYNRRHQVVEIKESHMKSRKDFKTFLFDVYCAKQIRENWRRRFDPKYRLGVSRKNKEANMKIKPDPKSYCQMLRNEQKVLAINKGVYSLRLAQKALNISLSEAGRLALFSEKKGETKRIQTYNPSFDKLKLTTLNQVVQFIDNSGNPDYHLRRIIKKQGWEHYRLKEICLLETTVEFSYSRYNTI